MTTKKALWPAQQWNHRRLQMPWFGWNGVVSPKIRWTDLCQRKANPERIKGPKTPWFAKLLNIRLYISNRRGIISVGFEIKPRLAIRTQMRRVSEIRHSAPIRPVGSQARSCTRNHCPKCRYPFGNNVPRLLRSALYNDDGKKLTGQLNLSFNSEWKAAPSQSKHRRLVSALKNKKSKLADACLSAMSSCMASNISSDSVWSSLYEQAIKIAVTPSTFFLLYGDCRKMAITVKQPKRGLWKAKEIM